MTLDEVAAGPSSLFCSGTGSSNISGLSKEQLDLLLDAFESNINPTAEQASELAEKLKLTTEYVQLWFRKEGATLEVERLLQGMLTTALQRHLEQDGRIRVRLDKLLEQENEQRINNRNIKLLEDEAKELKQRLERLITLKRENLVGEVQLSPPPTPVLYCDTGTRMRKRATEDSSDGQGEKNARRMD